MFQSTRPARGATSCQVGVIKVVKFQSTRPARGATLVSAAALRLSCVSIHAPRAGRDLVIETTQVSPTSFNPRAPRGARLLSLETNLEELLFQSTRPARGATSQWTTGGIYQRVSIHAPRAGRDPTRPGSLRRSAGFNPRAPRGARRRSSSMPSPRTRFNPRAPRGARPPFSVGMAGMDQFQSTRPARGATP